MDDRSFGIIIRIMLLLGFAIVACLTRSGGNPRLKLLRRFFSSVKLIHVGIDSREEDYSFGFRGRSGTLSVFFEESPEGYVKFFLEYPLRNPGWEFSVSVKPMSLLSTDEGRTPEKFRESVEATYSHPALGQVMESGDIQRLLFFLFRIQRGLSVRMDQKGFYLDAKGSTTLDSMEYVLSVALAIFRRVGAVLQEQGQELPEASLDFNRPFLPAPIENCSAGIRHLGRWLDGGYEGLGDRSPCLEFHLMGDREIEGRSEVVRRRSNVWDEGDVDFGLNSSPDGAYPGDGPSGASGGGGGDGLVLPSVSGMEEVALAHGEDESHGGDRVSSHVRRPPPPVGGRNAGWGAPDGSAPPASHPSPEADGLHGEGVHVDILEGDLRQGELGVCIHCMQPVHYDEAAFCSTCGDCYHDRCLRRLGVCKTCGQYVSLDSDQIDL